MYMLAASLHSYFFFFFNDTATTEIYTLSLHDALPISAVDAGQGRRGPSEHAAGHANASRAHDAVVLPDDGVQRHGDRKSTRLNSSHGYISYAVFCLKKKYAARDTVPRRPTTERRPRDP